MGSANYIVLYPPCFAKQGYHFGIETVNSGVAPQGLATSFTLCGAFSFIHSYSRAQMAPD